MVLPRTPLIFFQLISDVYVVRQNNTEQLKTGAQAYFKSVCVQITGVNMASQEEDNKLECISNINKDQERDFLNVYKVINTILVLIVH